MTLQWLLNWWNLIFVVPFGIALTYLAAYMLTGVTFGDADHGSDAGHDAYADPDLHADHDLDVDAQHDADGHASDGHAPDAHEDDRLHASDRGGHLSLLALVGVGTVPLSLLLMIALFVWGISGFALTQSLRPAFDGDGGRIALAAVPTAAIVTVVLTSVIAGAFGRVMPMREAPSVGRRDLIGRPGVAILEITESFGLARVSPTDGAPAVQVPCRVASGQASIAANAAVVVMRFDRDDALFYVTTPDRLAAFRAGDLGDTFASTTAR